MLSLLYVALQHATAQAHRAHAPAGTRAATGIHLPKCELVLPTLQNLELQLHNYPYIAAFAGGYWILWLLFRRSDARVFLSLLLTLLAAAGLEVGEVMTKRGLCRVQDLVPAVAGVLGAAVLLGIWSRLRRKPAYVRLVKRPARGARSAPLPPAPPSPRAGIPQRAVIYDPPPTGYAPPPPPPDFSPGPAPTAAGRPAAQSEPTEEVAPNRAVAARAAVTERLRAIFGRIQPGLQGLWASVLGRRRAIAIGLGVVVIIGAAAVVMLRTPSSVPVATEQPKAVAPPTPEAPPQAPRQLQSEVEGYYEPSYQFTVADRRFTRLTLRPDASVRFSRLGSRQDVGCADARISPAAVHLRCDFEAAGISVTIDGRFTARYASNRLDMPPLSASITVTNTRGETVYRARDSFYWHVPD